MKNYRKKLIVIQAIQYTGDNGAQVSSFIGERYLGSKSTSPSGEVYGISIQTLEGPSYALSKGDWVIKGVKGEMYPCKPDVFEKTYEEVVPEEKYTPHL